MAIDIGGTFDYHGRVSSNFESTQTIDLRQRTFPNERSGERLVGLAPQLIIDNDTAVIRATTRQHAACASFRFGLPHSVSKLLAAHDVLHIHRTCGGGLGFSLIRSNQLLFAMGAILSVPLGNVAAYHSRKVRDWKPKNELSSCEDYFIDFIFGENRTCRIHDTQSKTTHGYSIYVKNTFLRSLPGDNECVSIVSDDCLFDANHTEMVQHFLRDQSIESWSVVNEEVENGSRESASYPTDADGIAREAAKENISDQLVGTPTRPFAWKI